MALILLQPDLGTVLLFLPVLFAMLFAAGARTKHLLVILVLGGLCAPLFWLKIRDYQRLRITGVMLQSAWLRDYLAAEPTWLEGRPTRWDYLRSEGFDPDKWHNELVNWEKEKGYQLVRSKMAIGSGGLTGQGWGKGLFIEFNSWLPEKHNDFIFAVIGHEWGLVGTLLTLLCYVVIVVIGYDVATLTMDPFARLVAVGLSTMFAVQVLTNLCMTVGLGPITGVTLPFVSSGGSSVIASFLSIGLLLSVARHRPVWIARRPFEYGDDDTE
jgi:rod shape determining protein RodA